MRQEVPCMEERLTGVYPNQLYNVFDSVFTIISSSSIVSNPIAVHMCILKDLLAARFRVYPGQMFQIPVVLYGQKNGSFTGTVHCEFLNKSRGVHFAPLYRKLKKMGIHVRT